MTSLHQTGELAGLWSRRSGAVGGAAAFTFAAVLPRIGAAALALAIVLALARVLGEVGVRVVLGNQHAGGGRCAGGGGSVLRGRLSVQASGCAAEQTGKRSSECEGIYGMVLHR
jgi:hypothetical protein